MGWSGRSAGCVWIALALALAACDGSSGDWPWADPGDPDAGGAGGGDVSAELPRGDVDGGGDGDTSPGQPDTGGGHHPLPSPCTTDADCDDGDDCTTDTCDPLVGCRNRTRPGCFYEAPPDIGTCTRGAPSATEKALAVQRVNQLRALSGLPPVVYDSSADAAVQEAAIAMVAQGEIRHDLPDEWICRTAAAHEVANESNLHIRFSSRTGDLPRPVDMAIDSMFIDEGVPTLGHRRWILDPFLDRISLGSADGLTQVDTGWPRAQVVVLKVMHDSAPDLTGLDLDFIAYPRGDYPAELVEPSWFMSLSVLAEPAVRWGGNPGNQHVDFSDATITVVPEGSSATEIVEVAYDNRGYGLPNGLQWRLATAPTGVKHQVTVDGVRVGGATRQISYWFRLVAD